MKLECVGREIPAMLCIIEEAGLVQWHWKNVPASPRMGEHMICLFDFAWGIGRTNAWSGSNCQLLL